MSVYKINRRKFIGQASCMAVGGTSFMSSLLNLNTINAMALNNSSVSSCNDYKALVCLFNSGGLDSFNMLLPTTPPEYEVYRQVRSNNALPLNQPAPPDPPIPADDLIKPITVLNTPGRTFGVHPRMDKMKTLFEQGKLAFVSNVGALVAPMTKQEYENESVIAPLGLFSHSDQQMHWQTGFAHKRDAVGWGGKMAELLTSCNTNLNLPMSLSLSGSNLLQTGDDSSEFSINWYNPSGGINSDILYDDWWYWLLKKNSLTNMLDATYANIFEKTYKNKVKSSRDGIADISAALRIAPSFNGIFADNYLSTSFKIVAKLIAQQSTLGMNRQIYFIDYGGWDHHDELIQNQNFMMNEVDEAIKSFHDALVSINKLNSVTTFSISEFSRTLSSNGNGTDHAWGANAFVMGGAVNGQKIYGQYPTMEQAGPLEVGGGVFIPTTAAEEYFAEIALWFGVPASGLVDLFPNLTNFYSVGATPPIGFMNI